MASSGPDQGGSSAPPLLLSPEAAPDADTIEAISGGLGSYNDLFTPHADWAPRWIVGRDAGGVVQAGMRFVLEYDWVFVHWLWIAEPYRRRGVGSDLIGRAEAFAHANGCQGVYLDTFTFQAPKFYERLGFLEFGRIDDFPRGHARIWLAKRF
jgi:GNAT superfamily N-acetyltransferase